MLGIIYNTSNNLDILTSLILIFLTISSALRCTHPLESFLMKLKTFGFNSTQEVAIVCPLVALES